MIITPDTLIGDIIEGNVNIEAVANVLTSVGMHCLGCAIAHGETVGEAAEVHNVDVNELIARLNEATCTVIRNSASRNSARRKRSGRSSPPSPASK